MNWIDWAIPLPGLVFVFTVLDPLPALRRERIGRVATWLWLAVLLLAYLTSGFELGLVAAVVGSLTLGCLMQPLGEALAERLRLDETD